MISPTQVSHLLIMLKNSALVFGLLSKHPRTQLVTVLAPTFCTPLITIQKCELSITTPTPNCRSAPTTASTILRVNRSCTWSLREKTSAIRATLDSPIICNKGEKTLLKKPNLTVANVSWNNIYSPFHWECIPREFSQ